MSGNKTGVEIASVKALAAENERLMNQALLHQHANHRRKSEIERQAAEEAARLAREAKEEDESNEISLDADELEEARIAAELQREHDEMLDAEGIWRLYLILHFFSKQTVVSDTFNYLIVIVIIIAGINVGMQTYSDHIILKTLDSIILVCFSIEIILKILAEGFQPWKYWTGHDWKWNNFDFTIVFMSLPFWGGLFGTGSLALLRLVRLMRLGKLIKKIPALQMIVQGLIGGLSSIGYILILLFLVHYLFGVVGFFLFNENDPFHFGNVPMAMITLFRCSLLDKWAGIMKVNIYGCRDYPGPYLDPEEEDDFPSIFICEQPHAQLAVSGIFFVVFTVTSAMVMLSLFIGTVTMSMNQSMETLRLLSEKKRKREAFLKNKALATAKIVENATVSGSIKSREPMTIVRSKSEPVDTESSESVIPRSLSLGDPLMEGRNIISTKVRDSERIDPMRDQGPNASIHRAMYVQSVLDHEQLEDPDGRPIGGPFAFPFAFPSARRFSSRIRAIFSTNTTAKDIYERQKNTKRHLLLAMGEEVPDSLNDESRDHSVFTMRYLVFCDGCRCVAEDNRFINFVTLIIVLAGIVVGFQTDPRALAVKELADALNVLNVIILSVFTLECVLKIFGEGLAPWRYFNDGWNRFDFIIVVGSYVPGVGSLLVILRLLRLLRVLKLVRSLPQLAVILSALMLGLNSIGYIALILFLVYYVFGILGMILFSVNDPWHFGSLHFSMITLFRLATLENWHEVVYINMFGCDHYGLYHGVYADYPEQCKSPRALGFIAVVYFVTFVIVGTQVLLTLFIGVVTTSMDQASETGKALKKLLGRVALVQRRFFLSDIQIDNFRECFALLDLTNGGTIEEEGLKIGLEIVDSKMSDEEITQRMKAVDPSVNGIDLVGFIVFMWNLPKFKRKRMFLKVLRLYRAYKISKEEMERAAKYAAGKNRIIEILSSPRSLLSPRSSRNERIAAVHPEQLVEIHTHNNVTTSNRLEPSNKNISSIGVEMTSRKEIDGGEKMPEHETCTSERLSERPHAGGAVTPI